jgi:glycosyltransferase involved in cell wall biosynthesis
VPHYQCEPWLGDCLDSLVRQTRPPDGIVVIDDGSGSPPSDIVRQFPEVTLLASAENVGPYRITQAVIDQTSYDAYLLQDADDWSAPLRLHQLLTAAERTGAELIGCQGYRVLCRETEVVPLTHPLDVNAALKEWPTWYALLHPTSLVSRDLVLRIGGYATGLKFGGDGEFLHRATHAARVINIPQFAYFKRVWSGALTSRPDTSLTSPARKELNEIEGARARATAARAASGEELDLRPMLTAGPISLTHVVGPRLRPTTGGSCRDKDEGHLPQDAG